MIGPLRATKHHEGKNFKHFTSYVFVVLRGQTLISNLCTGIAMKSLIVALSALFLFSCSKSDMNQTTADSLKVKIARFAPVKLAPDLSKLSSGDRTATRSEVGIAISFMR